MNEHQIKDKINQLNFEINHLEKRKVECQNDASCISKLASEIEDRKREIGFLESGLENAELVVDEPDCKIYLGTKRDSEKPTHPIERTFCHSFL